VTSGPKFVQVGASAVAAPASTTPKPYLWFTWNPAPFVVQSGSSASFVRAVVASTARTSRQPRFGFAWITSATTPETSGVEDDVPLKVFV
jgi:hypothetical protein